MAKKWFNFDSTLIRVLEPKPGVFELVDKDKVTVYIGGADNLLRSLKQRCQKRRLENFLGKVPKKVRAELKAAILESFHAQDYEVEL